jgi:hypothetical protein
MSSHSHHNHSQDKAGVSPTMLVLLAVGAGVVAFLTFVSIHATNATPFNPIEMMR